MALSFTHTLKKLLDYDKLQRELMISCLVKSVNQRLTSDLPVQYPDGPTGGDHGQYHTCTHGKDSFRIRNITVVEF